MKDVALIGAILYMIVLGWIALDCDANNEYELKHITLGLAGIAPFIICVIISL